MREKFTEDQLNDRQLKQWVRGYQGYKDPVKSMSEAIDKFLVYAEEKDLYNLPNKTLPDEEKHAAAGPAFFYGRDKWGNPVMYSIIADYDFGYVHTNKDKCVECFLKLMQQFVNVAKEFSDARGAEQYQTTVIVDVHKIGISSAMWYRSAITAYTSVLQANFPETMFKLFFVNAASTFKAVWSFVSTMVHENTCTKVKVLSSSQMDILKEWIDEDQIPTRYGGKGPVEPTPGSITFFDSEENVGEWIDEDQIPTRYGGKGP